MSEQKNWKVLIADDEEMIRRLIAALIPWQELNLELAASVSNGLEAMEYLKDHPADILITDARMPECDGIQLVKWCSEQGRDMKYIVISGYRQFEYAHGALLGSVNGFCAIKLKVHPMVATMATMTIYQGIAYVSSNSETYFDFPAGFKSIGQGKVGPIPICVIIMIIAVLIGWFLLNKTYFGRYVYSLGGNEEATRLAGVNTRKVRMLIFLIAGLFVGVSAIVLTARTGSASAGIAADAMFSCFTACILGGISFAGGGGNILNVIVSVLILGVLSNGMQMMGASIYAQYIAKGILLVAAIAYDNYQKARRMREDK